MTIRTFLTTTALAVTTAAAPAFANDAPDASPEWLQRSNAIAYTLMESTARYVPEFAAQQGVSGYDEEIFDLQPNLYERQMESARNNLTMLEEKLAAEEDPRVRQDIEIMMISVRDNMEASQINYERVMPYGNLSGLVFYSFNGLLDKQVPPERRKAALVRLKKYTGQAEGYAPMTDLARERLSERMQVEGLITPFVGEVQQDLERAPTMRAGLAQLFQAAGLEGWEDDLALLNEQFEAHDAWVEENILPMARPEAKLPRELYELGLKNWGVSATPEELIRTGQVAFVNIRNEMMALAPLVAKEKGFETDDYREVIHLLKKDQVHGDGLMKMYQGIMVELDVIIEREGLATLPEGPARIRMKSAAETAALPAASLSTPRLVGNTGEFPEFLVPLIEQNEDGSWPQSDYAFPAQAWTLSAHEARPGHEMQYSAMIQGGVSTARALFAWNSANVEGWALYAEAIAKPYMPLEGQLLSLQARLLRATRIWLDPMLNMGQMSRAEAQRILMEEVVEDETNANSELDRYTFQMPGQATAYYYGYENLQALRANTEMRLKDRFEQQDFHDFILAQGLLPPELLNKAVEEEFVAPRLADEVAIK